MAGITGQGDTFDLPNYTGELFGVTPQDTPLLSAIGGLTGGTSVDSTVFSWQTFDLRTAANDRQRLEGANAPTAEARVRATVRNVVEIHQEQLEISYTKQAAIGQIASNGSSHPYGVAGTGSNPVTDEVDWQLRQHLVQIARDVEVGFIKNTLVEPTDNNTARKTAGLASVVTTNVKNNADTALDKDDVLDVMQLAYDNGGLMEGETRVLMCGSTQKRAISEAFVNSTDGYRWQDSNVGGVNCQSIETDFGMLNVVLNRHVPSDEVYVLSLEDLEVCFLEIPGKGHFFVEELAKSGAADKFQIYGEIGLKYGNEKKHGRLHNIGGYSS
jgi:hypothetical protein